ncbi:hypothetical protein SAMN05443244_3746 [Terriglobus roseus]|uniref:Uncharacterized protein n=1 Tax=Terriglobus roseus TaxID=392734 RepID=A0A1H4TGG0_9BACT|nr:hypothetical protein SAMN05443244_3746 [Terriglobus roseus]
MHSKYGFISSEDVVILNASEVEGLELAGGATNARGGAPTWRCRQTNAGSSTALELRCVSLRRTRERSRYRVRKDLIAIALGCVPTGSMVKSSGPFVSRVRITATSLPPESATSSTGCPADSAMAVGCGPV